jgi:hypothetical protein
MLRSFITLIAFLFLLTGCDVDLFGTNSKKLGGGYSLALSEIDGQCGLIPPKREFGPLVDAVGWKEPIILARPVARKAWGVIDTTTRKEMQISDEQRMSDPVYREIPLYRAGDAWKRLKRDRSLS